jgi:predicted metal-dependent peptidase
MATDGYYIYVNPEFAETLPEAQVQGVIAHELLHCVLGHIDRCGDRDRELWNVAIDLATNLMLLDFGFELPAMGLRDPAVRGMTAEQVYDRLCRDEKMRGAALAARRLISRAGERGVGASRGPGSRGVLDRHVNPGDVEGSDLRAQEFPTSIERTRLRRDLSMELAAHLHGHAAGLLEAEITAAQSTGVPWQVLLAQFFSGLRRNDYRWMPPAKRHLWRGLYLPSIGTPGPHHIAVAVDTSGSMSEATLGAILGELDRLRSMSECSLTLIQFDAALQGVVTYDAWDVAALDFSRYRLRGRGGTSFVPLFDWVREQGVETHERLDGLFIMTDGYGTFPERAAELPCVWIMPPSGNDKVPFGETVKVTSLEGSHVDRAGH